MSEQICRVESSPEVQKPTMRMKAAQLDLLYRSAAPFMVWPGYEDSITAEMKARAMLARLANPITGQCSDYEACLYLMTASQVAPFGHTWYKIYATVFCRCFPEHAATIFGDQMEHLESYEEAQLRDFKAWVYKRQIEAIKAQAGCATSQNLRRDST